MEEMSARKRLGDELTKLRGGERALSLVNLESHSMVKGPRLPRSSLSDWFNGRAVPSVEKLNALVALLTQRPPTPELKALYRKALAESARERGRRSAPQTDSTDVVTPLARLETVQSSRLPRIDTLHYANIPRLVHLLAMHQQPMALPEIPAPPDRDMIGLATASSVITSKLGQVDLPVKRFTLDLNLRELREGDLMVFDRRVHTLNGPRPNQTLPPTGDLNIDPLVYLKRDGVRIVMPYDPRFITTSTAYNDFRSGQVQMLGLCVIKRRLRPSDAPHRRKKPKVQFLASPLLLGLSSWEHRDEELTRRAAITGEDREGNRIAGRPWRTPPSASQAG